METPTIEAPGSESPTMETPTLEAPGSEAPTMETPTLEMPAADDSEDTESLNLDDLDAQQDPDFSTWMEGLGQWPRYPKSKRRGKVETRRERSENVFK